MSLALPPYVKALLKPEAYPHRPASVELLQTQMSFIFIAGDYTYKTKKAVNLGYLDYTTLRQREKFCRQELELNRRLSPGAYLEIVPISQEGHVFHLGGEDNVIEYAVKMKTLPRQRMMDALLAANRVRHGMLKKLARKMADFHSRAATDEQISSYGSLEAIKTNTDENFNQTEKYIGKLLTARVFNFIRDYTDRFIDANRNLFNERASTGKIRDCHGDLHTQHVCFADDIYIYDCIEFNDRFRYCDVASEIAFLAMDIDRFGRADLSRVFVDDYIKASGDRGIAPLLAFYKCYRAYVRGKVACFKYDDPYLENKDELRTEAGLYFNLAHIYANRKPCLIIVTGLIGTGKTTFAQRAARALGCDMLSSDIIRKQLAGAPAVERHYDSYSNGLYSPEITKKTYGELFSQGRERLIRSESVILDASFKKRGERLAAQKLAEDSGAGFLVVECTADEGIIKRRLEARQKGSAISDGRWEIFADFKNDFDAVNEFDKINHLILDTANSSGNINALLLEKLTAL